MKQDYEKQITSLLFDMEKVVDNMQKEIDNSQQEYIKQSQTIQELQDQITYFQLFFGKSFKVAQQMYEQQKLVNHVIEVVNDITGDVYYYNDENDDKFDWKDFLDYSDKENNEV
ncbi:31102_t:CDS:1 [Gigaspora margarita]|uniref:31102_t:CDS:1 n=1 Tax=Gigaspora margarita TaxID=4874 RepID=A0ABN7VYG0_GIGMA|nr:31102_t:CDS:1 [Gigaspora margarita]